MDFMQGGELFYHLAQSKRFDESKARFYCAEIILALEYLHSKNIVYRYLTIPIRIAILSLRTYYSIWMATFESPISVSRKSTSPMAS
jgi:hypothetical protein